MSVMAPRRGYVGAALSEQRRWCIHVFRWQRWRRLPWRGLLAAALATAPQRNYGGGFVGVAGGGSAPWVGGGVLATLGHWRPQMQQPTIGRGGKGRRWLRSRRLMGGNTTNSRRGQEREATARREVKTEAQTEVQTATMTARLSMAPTTRRPPPKTMAHLCVLVC
jgi:hypothetical protein